MSAMVSQITSLTIVYSTVYSRRKSKKTPKRCVSGLCEGNSPVTDEVPVQRASNAENVSIWWQHHACDVYHTHTTAHDPWRHSTNVYPVITIFRISHCKYFGEYCGKFYTWWRHQMETFSALLAFCVGNSPVTGEFPSPRPVTRRFDVFFTLHLCKRLSKQSLGWWFETPSRSLWCHCNACNVHPGAARVTLYCCYRIFM